MRTFIVPMQAPKNGTGKGTPQDPWRPKYLLELGLDYRIHNARDFCLAEVWGDESALDELAKNADVTELTEDDNAVPALRKSAIGALCAESGVSLSKDATGRELLDSLRKGIAHKQRTVKPTAAHRLELMQRLGRG